MIIVKVMGGLGNQMFQYAFMKLLESKGEAACLSLQYFSAPAWDRLTPDSERNQFYNQNYHRHKYYLEELFHIDARYATEQDVARYVSNGFIARVLRRLGLATPRTISEAAYFAKGYQNDASNIKNGLLDGYWQQLSLYEPIADTLRRDFTFKKPLDARNQAVADEMGRTNSVALHVRRGDYLRVPEVYPALDAEYYAEALRRIELVAPSPKIYCFSDDVDWCRENLPFSDMTFVDWNLGEDNYKDMQLMSLCKHNVIANSTFSVWAAWLNRNPEKIVVCPSIFIYNNKAYGIDHFLPEEWVKVAVD